MNLANRITLFRFFLTPLYCLIFAVAFIWEFPISWILIPLWAVFLLSEISDIADGWVARRNYLVTDLGKLMDPFADVIFRTSYLFLFSLLDLIPWWATLIILWREFTILFIRMLLIKEGSALAAGPLGKIKAVFYFLTGSWGQIYLSLNDTWIWYPLAGKVLYFLGIGSAVMAVLSLTYYLYLFSKQPRKMES